VFILEVKRPDIHTNLHLPNKYTAQVLREAHIVLRKTPNCKEIPFALTNSLLWSFGLAQMADDNKLQVVSTKNLLDTELSVVQCILKKYSL
jgi:hypothetical protein